MSHTVVLGLFNDASAAAAAARNLRALGIDRERVSIVARSHDEEGAVADASDASPGAEIEDSARASRLGELGGHLIAAIAVVMPGIGPIVADGPLAAGLGEAAGHLAGGLARTLEQAGVPRQEAEEWESRIHGGAFLVGAHVSADRAPQATDVLQRAGATRTASGTLPD
jgi:hypothetical protein